MPPVLLSHQAGSAAEDLAQPTRAGRAVRIAHLPLALRWALAQASRRLGAAPQSVALLAMRHVRALILEVAVFKERYARALGMDCADSDSDALLADTAADLSYIS